MTPDREHFVSAPGPILQLYKFCVAMLAIRMHANVFVNKAGIHGCSVQRPVFMAYERG